jgi:hypothetical protein
MDWLRRILRPSLAAAKAPLADGQAMWRMASSCTDPKDFARFEQSIRHGFHLHRRLAPHAIPPQNTPQRQDEISLLASDPKVAAGFVFHGDGVIREAALKALQGPIELPVIAYGMMRRLNDWSPEVRAAAAVAVPRCFATSDKAILAPAVWLLLSQAQSWGRWSGSHSPYERRFHEKQGDTTLRASGYAAFVEMVMARTDLLALLVDRLCQTREGGTTQVFHAMSRNPAFDPFLERIARQARQPHLRAAATYGLLAGKLSWPLGRKKQVWVDKSLGQSRLEPEFGTRPLTNTVAPEPVLRHAFADRSTMVKREAFDRLTALRHLPELAPLIDDCLTAFAETPVPVLRKRRDYLAKVTAKPTGDRTEV